MATAFCKSGIVYPSIPVIQLNVGEDSAAIVAQSPLSSMIDKRHIDHEIPSKGGESRAAYCS